MTEPQLVVMAAGIGNRYGGLKQIDSVGPSGETLIDYAIYDAMQVGFKRFVFVIRKELEEDFRDVIGKKIEERAEVRYAFQEIDLVPDGYTVPKERTRPWGTGHAPYAAKDVVDSPFGVINADDFYGRSSYKLYYDYLKKAEDKEKYDYCMIGFELQKTLSDYGTVSRAICQFDEDRYLYNSIERTKLKMIDGQTKYTEDGETWVGVPNDSIVSMNMWGFTPSVFPEMERLFKEFLDENINDLKAEFFLPFVANELVRTKKATLKVMSSNEKWYGLTYPEDKEIVRGAITEMIEKGIYPKKLWD